MAEMPPVRPRKSTVRVTIAVCEKTSDRRRDETSRPSCGVTDREKAELENVSHMSTGALR